MPKTASGYVPDSGEVVVTISADNVSDIAAFTTAEDIVIDGVVRSFRRTNNPERSVESTRVTGDDDPIITVGNSIPHETWELVIVDDYSAGNSGEWGTDNLAAGEIFDELFRARASTEIGGLACTPAGSETGDIERTLTNPRLISVGEPEIDADAGGSLATQTIMIAAEGHTKATHA